MNVPFSWQSVIEPDVIASLMPAKDVSVKVQFVPPENVGVGDYEMQIQSRALADIRPVETQDKTVRVHVSAILVLSVTGMVVGIVWYGVKLTRR